MDSLVGQYLPALLCCNPRGCARGTFAKEGEIRCRKYCFAGDSANNNSVSLKRIHRQRPIVTAVVAFAFCVNFLACENILHICTDYCASANFDKYQSPTKNSSTPFHHRQVLGLEKRLKHHQTVDEHVIGSFCHFVILIAARHHNEGQIWWPNQKVLAHNIFRLKISVLDLKFH